MARYGQEFKDRAVAQLLPPESATVESVAREIGVGVSTLERWRRDALSRPAPERAWTAAARFEAALTTATLDEAGKSAWSREHRVYPQELAQQDRRRIKELERELRRKDKALAETAALLVLSKKVAAIFNRDEDE